jgi:hypothetical protein
MFKHTVYSSNHDNRDDPKEHIQNTLFSVMPAEFQQATDVFLIPNTFLLAEENHFPYSLQALYVANIHYGALN